MGGIASVLIVDDNPKFLADALPMYGYDIEIAQDGLEALKILAKEDSHFDLILLDVMMPNMDGWELTRELREAKVNIPILLVTARDTLEDKRMGFTLGADDYLTKPVDFEEMLLRIGALLRRCRLQQDNALHIGGCTLNAETLQVEGEGYALELRPREFALLEKLLSSPTKIFTRQMLMDEIWGYDSESDPRTVDTHIKRLREKLGDCASYIKTVVKAGYRLEAEE